MKAVRAFILTLTVLAVGFACERSPTGLREPPASDSAVLDSSRSQTAPKPSYDRRVGNYAVAW